MKFLFNGSLVRAGSPCITRGGGSGKGLPRSCCAAELVNLGAGATSVGGARRLCRYFRILAASFRGDCRADETALRFEAETTCESHHHAYRIVHAIAILHHRPSLHGANGG